MCIVAKGAGLSFSVERRVSWLQVGCFDASTVVKAVGVACPVDC